MRTFAAFLKPVRERLRVLTLQPQQLTLVFDAGASSKSQPAEAGSGQGPLCHRRPPLLPASAAGRSRRSSGRSHVVYWTVVRAWRTQRVLAGQQRDVVVVFSPQLYEGQVRGLQQHLARCGEQLKELGTTHAAHRKPVRRKLAQICGRQYLRTLVRYEVQSNEQGGTQVRSWSDLEEYRRLLQHYSDYAC